MKHEPASLFDGSDAGTKSLVADRVEIAFKDQNISRRDMWQLATQRLDNLTVYKNKQVVFEDIRARIRSI